MPSQTELRDLSAARLEDAEVLYRAGRYDAAAYMCGYALELALKACICRRLRLQSYPGSSHKQAFWTHNFEDLKLLAGLRDVIAAHINKDLYKNWSAATDWEPEWRYRPAGSTTKEKVEEMLRALREGPNGVLPWLRKRR